MDLLSTDAAPTEEQWPDEPPPPARGAALPIRSNNGGSAQIESRRWRAFALLVVAYFMTIVDLTIVNVALPTIGVKLHFPRVRPAVGRHGLRADLRRLPAPRGPSRRPAGPAAPARGGPGHLHRCVTRLRPGHVRHLPHRHARDSGVWGSAGVARRPLDRDEHVPRGSGAQQGPGHLGCCRRHGRHGRSARRWPAHPLCGVAVHLLLQCAHRPGCAGPGSEGRAREPAAQRAAAVRSRWAPSPSLQPCWSSSMPSPRRLRWAGPPRGPWPCSRRRRLCSSPSS